MIPSDFDKDGYFNEIKSMWQSYNPSDPASLTTAHAKRLACICKANGFQDKVLIGTEINCLQEDDTCESGSKSGTLFDCGPPPCSEK